METIEKIMVPQGFTVEAEGLRLKVSDGKRTNERTFKASKIRLEKEGDNIVVKAADERRKTISTAKSIATHIRNMIKGVEKDFEYKLAVVYSHFPMNIAVKGNIVEVNNFLGEKKPRKAKIVGETKIEVKGKEIVVKGHALEAVGQTAANLEQIARSCSRDRRVYNDGIYMVSKKGQV